MLAILIVILITSVIFCLSLQFLFQGDRAKNLRQKIVNLQYEEIFAEYNKYEKALIKALLDDFIKDPNNKNCIDFESYFKFLSQLKARDSNKIDNIYREMDKFISKNIQYEESFLAINNRHIRPIPILRFLEFNLRFNNIFPNQAKKNFRDLFYLYFEGLQQDGETYTGVDLLYRYIPYYSKFISSIADRLILVLASHNIFAVDIQLFIDYLQSKCEEDISEKLLNEVLRWYSDTTDVDVGSTGFRSMFASMQAGTILGQWWSGGESYASLIMKLQHNMTARAIGGSIIQEKSACELLVNFIERNPNYANRIVLNLVSNLNKGVDAYRREVQTHLLEVLIWLIENNCLKNIDSLIFSNSIEFLEGELKKNAKFLEDITKLITKFAELVDANEGYNDFIREAQPHLKNLAGYHELYGSINNLLNKVN